MAQINLSRGLVTRTGVTLHWLVQPTIAYVHSSRRVSEWVDTGQALQCWYHYDFDTSRYGEHSRPFCTRSLAHHWCDCRPPVPTAWYVYPREREAEGATDGVHEKRRQSDADAAAAVCEQRTCETCVRARYRTIYARHDIVRSMNPRSISRYRVIDMITSHFMSNQPNSTNFFTRPSQILIKKLLKMQAHVPNKNPKFQPYIFNGFWENDFSLLVVPADLVITGIFLKTLGFNISAI